MHAPLPSKPAIRLLLLRLTGLASVALCARLSAQAIPYESPTLFVPVVVATAGQPGSFFPSELVDTNYGDLDTTVTYRYTAAQGGGSGTVTNASLLMAHRQRVVPDAIAYLRELGLDIPLDVNVCGTLRVTFNSVSFFSSAAVLVRTTTPVPVSAPTGRAGLAYTGLRPASLLDGPSCLAGLRQSTQDRTNVAVQNAGAPDDGPITLRLTYIPSGGPPGETRDVTLLPGGFFQASLTSFDPGASGGSVRVERTSGTALYYAYAVVNDQVNSDGSFLTPVALRPPETYSGIGGLVLPTVVETPTYQTEVVLANLTSGSVAATLTGALTLKSGASIGSFFLAGRTLSPGGGGRYGVFTTARPYRTGTIQYGLLNGLRQDQENRTNLAIVNMGDASSAPLVPRIEIFDGETGEAVTTVNDPSLSVPPGGFLQLNSFLAKYAPGTRQAWLRLGIRGDNGMIFHAVVNDGARPDQRSGDGAVTAIDPNDTVLTQAPADLDDVAAVIPLGNVNPAPEGGHVPSLSPNQPFPGESFVNSTCFLDYLTPPLAASWRAKLVGDGSCGRPGWDRSGALMGTWYRADVTAVTFQNMMNTESNAISFSPCKRDPVNRVQIGIGTSFVPGTSAEVGALHLRSTRRRSMRSPLNGRPARPLLHREAPDLPVLEPHDDEDVVLPVLDGELPVGDRVAPLGERPEVRRRVAALHPDEDRERPAVEGRFGKFGLEGRLGVLDERLVVARLDGGDHLPELSLGLMRLRKGGKRDEGGGRQKEGGETFRRRHAITSSRPGGAASPPSSPSPSPSSGRDRSGSSRPDGCGGGRVRRT